MEEDIYSDLMYTIELYALRATGTVPTYINATYLSYYVLEKWYHLSEQDIRRVQMAKHTFFLCINNIDIYFIGQSNDTAKEARLEAAVRAFEFLVDKKMHPDYLYQNNRQLHDATPDTIYGYLKMVIPDDLIYTLIIDRHSRYLDGLVLDKSKNKMRYITQQHMTYYQPYTNAIKVYCTEPRAFSVLRYDMQVGDIFWGNLLWSSSRYIPDVQQLHEDINRWASQSNAHMADIYAIATEMVAWSLIWPNAPVNVRREYRNVTKHWRQTKATIEAKIIDIVDKQIAKNNSIIVGSMTTSQPKIEAYMRRYGYYYEKKEKSYYIKD